MQEKIDRYDDWNSHLDENSIAFWILLGFTFKSDLDLKHYELLIINSKKWRVIPGEAHYQLGLLRLWLYKVHSCHVELQNRELLCYQLNESARGNAIQSSETLNCWAEVNLENFTRWVAKMAAIWPRIFHKKLSWNESELFLFFSLPYIINVL